MSQFSDLNITLEDNVSTRREFLRSTASGGMAGILAVRTVPVYAKNATRRKREVSLAEAEEVHKRAIIVDGHNDTPVERVARGEAPLNWMQRDMSFHTDIPRMREAGYDSGFMIVGNGPTANMWVTLERVLTQIDQNPDALLQVNTSQDVLRAHREGKLGVILSIEGIGRWIDGNVDTLRLLHRFGLRLAGITHGEGGIEPIYLQGTKSPYGPCTQAERENERKNAGGLSQLGRDVLEASNELGIVTDLSHSNDRTFYEVLERTSRPPIMSHTAVFALCNHWRCLTDDQIRALADAGGAMGIAFAPMFIHPDSEKATIDRVAEHVCYVADLVGIDYVGIGTDYDGLGDTPPVVREVSQLVKLTRSMMELGLTEEEIQKVWGGNFLRLLRQNIG